MMVSVGHDNETKRLEIEFPKGKVYEYEGVPRAIFDGLMRATSKGKFFAAWIDGRYRHVELD